MGWCKQSNQTMKTPNNKNTDTNDRIDAAIADQINNLLEDRIENAFARLEIHRLLGTLRRLDSNVEILEEIAQEREFAKVISAGITASRRTREKEGLQP